MQLAVQAVLDVASHVVSDESLGEPATNRELFGLLARAGWLEVLRAANHSIHGYLAFTTTSVIPDTESV